MFPLTRALQRWGRERPQAPGSFGALAATGLAAVTAGLGCSSLDGYSTAAGESYCGAVTADATFRTGLPAGLTMRLTLDAGELEGEISPGAVWVSPDASSALPSQRLLDGATLRRIPALENDPLSMPDLGGGREHTHLFAVTPGATGEDALLAVLSLRSDEGVEVRLLRPGLGGAPPAGKQAVFGLFVLYKQGGTCGF
jgi:hypothetical protein